LGRSKSTLQREELEVDSGFDRQVSEGDGRIKRRERKTQASVSPSLSTQQVMPVLIIGWSVYDKLPEHEQQEFALVRRYNTAYFYECYEYENAKGNKNYEWSDRCFNSQEELLDFFGYEMIEDLNADAVYARRVETFTDEDENELMKLSDAGNQIKVIGAN